MGFFSIFNPDLIKEVTLYKGHIPAQYGGRVSSVLDVQLKGNNYDQFKINGGVGFLASRIAIETPIVKDKTSLLIGGRVAYSDWVLNFVLWEGNERFPLRIVRARHLLQCIRSSASSIIQSLRLSVRILLVQLSRECRQ